MSTKEAERERRDLEAQGYEVYEWSNGPGYEYAPHSHPYRKILWCLEGSISFRFESTEVLLASGDRTEIGPGTEHSAVVGPSGVRCAEAHL
jgi:quercetin dioxygenase-like cupin family protein